MVAVGGGEPPPPPPPPLPPPPEPPELVGLVGDGPEVCGGGGAADVVGLPGEG